MAHIPDALHHTRVAARRLRASPARRGRAVAAAAALLALGTSGACSRRPAVEQVRWSPGGVGRELRGAYGGGAVAHDAAGTWLAYEEEASPGEWRIRVRHLGGADPPGTPVPLLASLPGRSPHLVVHAGRPTILCHAGTPGREFGPVLYTGSEDGRTWGAPRAVETGAGASAGAPGGLLVTSGGTWIFPLVRAAGSPSCARALVCLRSQDDGTSWLENVLHVVPEAADPALVESAPGSLLLVVRLGTTLARASSRDDGTTWSALEPIDALADTLPPALGATPDGIVLAWTDAPPDTSWAVPGLRAVRLALTANGGETWRPLRPLVWSAGRTPWVPGLASSDDGLTALVVRRTREASLLDCVQVPLGHLRLPAAGGAGPSKSYAADPVRAAAALELLCEHTLLRPGTSIKLFIEGYFMRALVAGHEVLRGLPSVAELGVAPVASKPPASTPPGGVRLLDTQQGLTRAVTFADWMLGGQDAAGYWPLGYKAVYVADMAAVTALFAALEPHVDASRVQRYEAAAARFAAALERDGMFLPSGACGVGWPETRTPHDSLAARTPYLVSTALAGVELQAWLYARTRNERYRQRALAALDYTLSRLGADGSFPVMGDGPAAEGAYVAAAYVQEGWMAADMFLRDDAVRGTLRQALKKHVTWLVQTQNADGTWGRRDEAGEWARTPPIVNFLIWYDRRCESNPQVQAAVRRASVTLADPDAWRNLGLARRGKNEEVMRALAGRALAALAKGSYVF